MDLENLMAITKTFQDHLIYLGDGKGRLNTSREELFRTQPLLWNIAELQDKYRFSPRPTFYLSFIDHLMADRGGTKVRVDALIATHLSNMIVIDDILASIRYHRPAHDVDKDGEIFLRLSWSQPGGQSSRLQAGFRSRWPGGRSLWPHLQKLLDLPLPSPKISRSSLVRRRDLRHATEAFWDSVAAGLQVQFVGLGFAEVTVQEFVKIVGYTHSQKYETETAEEFARLEQALKEKEEEQARLDSNKPEAPLVELPSQTWAPESSPARIQVERRQKIKTKAPEPTANSSRNTEEQLATPDGQEPPLTLIVKFETKALFDRTFSAAAGANQGDIGWETFVAAMVDAGCSATPTGGSAVSFKDVGNTKASIVFHRPHPDPSIDLIMLRSMGKRLQKWFGWDAETFVERE
ncbi:hypothetical protein LTR53_009516 [Teratosphaeriaceae sp. CCFEE 6253]|nr:hypothetical protein LTR53_009516 [Teratosphaeriaceae sp. CCFEE 6253]